MEKKSGRRFVHRIAKVPLHIGQFTRIGNQERKKIGWSFGKLRMQSHSARSSAIAFDTVSRTATDIGGREILLCTYIFAHFSTASSLESPNSSLSTEWSDAASILLNKRCLSSAQKVHSRGSLSMVIVVERRNDDNFSLGDEMEYSRTRSRHR